MAQLRDTFADQSEGDMLADDLGPLFSKLIVCARGARFHVPKIPTVEFIERFGEDLARALIVRMPGSLIRVPRREFFTGKRLQAVVLSLYARGASLANIVAHTGSSLRSVQQTLAEAMAFAQGSFKTAQRERVLALAQQGRTAGQIASMSRIDTAGVMAILNHAGATCAKAPVRSIATGAYAPISTARIRTLWEAGFSDLRIATECRWPLSEVQIALNAIGAKFDEYGQPDAATAARMNSDTASDARQRASVSQALPHPQVTQEEAPAAS